MKILEQRTFEGPNVYALFPVVRMRIDLGQLEHHPTSAIESFGDRLLRAVPNLAEHGCCYGEPGGFSRRLASGTWMGHVVEHVAIALQNVVGQDVSFGKTRSCGDFGHYDVVFACRDVTLGLAAGRAALQIVEAVLPPRLRTSAQPDRPDEIIAAFRREAGARSLGPSTAALVRAAEARGIAWRRLADDSLIQLGFGRYLRRIWGTVTTRTSCVAVDLACNKAQARALLRTAGIPTPRQAVVEDSDTARAAAAEIGFPVVIKPRDGNHGRGVSVCRSAHEVDAAFEAAAAVSHRVLVESFVHGHDHRLLVVGGRLVAAALREPGHVVGDGDHTIAQLVGLTNADPRRGEGHDRALTKLALDDEAMRCLDRADLSPRDVPAKGRRVVLRETANLSTGGTAIDVTDRVHPEVRLLAERAARVIGLDVAGIDYLTPDISLPAAKSDGAVCEVNASPGLRMHLHPSQGVARDVAGPIIEALFPPDAPTAIPIAAITGTNGKTTTGRMLAHICRSLGTVGLATTDGVYVDDRLIEPGDLTGPVGAGMVLGDPGIDVAVLEVGRGGLLRAGLGAPYVDVGAVTNVSADHIGLDGVRDEDQMAELKRIVVEVARDLAVLNGDDPRVRAMAEHCRAQRLCFVTESTDANLVRMLRKRAQAVVTLETMLEGELIVLHSPRAVVPIAAVQAIPATLGGIARHNVANAMFAAAMAWGLGVPTAAIGTALSSFACDFATMPGRFNIYDGHPFRVILDYAHNPGGFARMVDAVDRLAVSGRRIVVVGMAGDRRDEDFRAAAEVLRPSFDHFICRGEDDTRGRPAGHLSRLMAQTFLEAGANLDDITVIENELEATHRALAIAQPGDLVVVFGVKMRANWDLIRTFAPKHDEVAAHVEDRALPPADPTKPLPVSA